jgi:hypothetical protein
MKTRERQRDGRRSTPRQWREGPPTHEDHRQGASDRGMPHTRQRVPRRPESPPRYGATGDGSRQTRVGPIPMAALSSRAQSPQRRARAMRQKLEAGRSARCRCQEDGLTPRLKCTKPRLARETNRDGVAV